MRPPRGRGGFRGGRDGGRFGGRGGRFGGGGRGGGRDDYNQPPEEVVVTKLTNEKVPYFNAPIYLQNMTQIGKVDEIFGPINESYFSIKMMEGIVATSYSAGDKFYIDPAKLLPLARFLSQPKYVSFYLLLEEIEQVTSIFASATQFRNDNYYVGSSALKFSDGFGGVAGMREWSCPFMELELTSILSSAAAMAFAKIFVRDRHEVVEVEAVVGTEVAGGVVALEVAAFVEGVLPEEAVEAALEAGDVVVVVVLEAEGDSRIPVHTSSGTVSFDLSFEDTWKSSSCF
ncbi:H/ACA ribonucleoprotein complex, subunit Gar1/Naf1 protein [Actinidia rufa]|uniref:H/ACA ribonucleoprotein complex subunit n=1 Tax=Actinidia rufa TaxID=165716 RepID=A0A7J0FZ20_9ERIC|nr:H/ACA ribonucleoprotein complex, subunit Gar1/Naf1 protein [Actinidia rufa]